MALRNRGGRWHYRFKIDGKTYAESTGLAATERNKTKATQAEMKHRQALSEGREPERRVTVREFETAATEFLKWANVEYREHPNSARRIRVSFTSLTTYFARTPVSMIDAGKVEGFKTWRLTERKEGDKVILPVRDITLRHDLHALSTFFNYAQKQHWTNYNPVRDVDIPSDKDAVRIHVLTAAEESLYFQLAGVNTDLHDLGRLMLNQGARPEELLSLKKTDVNIEQGYLKITFGKSAAARRKLTLTTESKSILARRIDASKTEWIFPTHKAGSNTHVPRLNSAHDRVLRLAAKKNKSLSFVLYDLRHTWATRAAQLGIDLATLAAMLGHSSIRIVQKYVHPTEEHKAAAMLRYEQMYPAQSLAVQ